MLIFEQDTNEHIAYTISWDESYLALILDKVHSVFSHTSDLIVEIWPHYGQIAFWEKDEKLSKNTKGVHIKVEEWFIGWNSIADKGLSDEQFELEISIYESNLAKFIIPKLKCLEDKFKVEYFLTDENEIVL